MGIGKWKLKPFWMQFLQDEAKQWQFISFK